MERLGYHRQLTQLGHGLDAGYDGDGDAHLARLADEVEVFLVVEEQLRHGILRSQVLLLLQILHVTFQVGSLLVFLRIAGHTEVECRTGMLDGCAVGKETLVETRHLADEVRGVGMATWRRRETAVLLGFVATQQHEVADAQKLQVQQFVLNVLNSLSAADDVWLYRNVVAVLDGSGDGDGARPATDALALELPVAEFLVDVFRVVGGDIDECRIEHGQLVDGLKQRLRTVAFQWRQYFKGEVLLVGVQFDVVCYCHCAHLALESYKIS